MKKKLLLVAIVICMTLTLMPAFASEANAYVKGSTAYLIDHAKNSRYVGKNLKTVKSEIKAQGYKGWRMDYNYDWCAWYLSNCANAAYVGNYLGMNSLSKSTYVDVLANNFAKYNDTTKKYPGEYTPKAGDIVVEGNEAHIGIMVSSTEAAYGNDGSQSYNYTKVKVRSPYNVSYYVPRPNWVLIYYSDGLKSTSNSTDMQTIKPHKVNFNIYESVSKNKFTRAGYKYSYWYIYKEDFNKKTGKITRYYLSDNIKTGGRAWVKSGTQGYKKYKKKVGEEILLYYDRNIAGAKVIFTPVWEKI